MAPLLIPLFFFLTLLQPVNESLLQMSKTVKELAELDKEIGDRAEELSSLINAALQLNHVLRGFHASCAVATVTLTLPEVKAAAEATRLLQDTLLFEAQMLMQLRVPLTRFERNLNNPQRKSGQVCEMPDVLECLQKDIFSIRNHDGAKPAGVKGETQNCAKLRWYYHDERVHELE